MNSKCSSYFFLPLALAGALLTTTQRASALSFTNYPVGDDVTPSMGQFQLVLEPNWERIFDLIIPNSPLGSVRLRHGDRMYHNGVFTSPTLYDPSTLIGRSDSFVAGSHEEAAGTLAGRAPGRTYIQPGQAALHPTWPAPSNGVHIVHTFLKSMHLTDSLTTHFGFSVKAGMLATNRPVSAGRVEGGSADQDFPANSYFNVYVVVDLPSGGLLPPIQLVNIEPLLVQHTNITSFPPRLIYQHENPAAVPLYFNRDCVIPDVEGGTNINVARGTLFGQLTLAGHGVGFSQVEIESFETEFETEHGTNVMSLTQEPTTHVEIEDHAPDYNAKPPRLEGSHRNSNGSLLFSLGRVPAGVTNYLQMRTNLHSGSWVTIATNITTTNATSFIDSEAGSRPQGFYRLTLEP